MRWTNPRLLEELLSFVASNPHSSFYADKYRSADIEPDPVHFFDLPPLTRGELVETPFSKRLYAAPEEVRFVAVTSGTSASTPLMTPFCDVENYHVEPALGMGVERPLIIYPPLNRTFGHTFIQQCRQAKEPVSPLFGDVQNLENSAVLAREFACDSLYATPTLAALFAERAHAHGTAGNFKLLALSSETLTQARRDQLRELYPNARIANLYASSEIGQFALVPCPQMIEAGKSEFHVIAEALAAVELVEGELVVSYGLNQAMPLVRYRTGDRFEEVEGGCQCGLPGPVLRWSYRATDRMRINGVEFDVEEADRAFGAIASYAGANYQVHFRPAGASAAIAVELLDLARAKATIDSSVLAQRIATELLDSWRLAPGATLRSALERKLFVSLTVSFVPQFSSGGLKVKRFVNHLS